VDQISFPLKPLPPFRLDYTVWVLRRRPDNTWDRWDGRTYRRVLVVNEKALEVAVTQTGRQDEPDLKVMATGTGLTPEIETPLSEILGRVLGLRTDLTSFYRLAGEDAKLNSLAAKFRGLKPPRYPTVFEALVNAITCQQFTLTAGIRLLGRMVNNWGLPFPGMKGEFRAFPRPRDLAPLEWIELRNLGFSRQKAESLIELARKVINGGLNLEDKSFGEDEVTVESLTRLRGVGRWTAEYALLRGYGHIHIFPGDDVGVRNKLQSWLKITQPLDYEGVVRFLRRWKPYGGFIYFLLLLNHLDEQGYLANTRG